MKVKFVFAVLLMLLSNLTKAQYYDTSYVKELTNRVLISYFQEYRSMEINVSPKKIIDSTGKESLKLSSTSTLFSGFLIQYKAFSIYIAGNSAQTNDNKLKYGLQNSTIWKISALYKAFFTNFNYIKYKGFYDENFYEHAYHKLDGLPYSRYQNLNTTWINFDLKYYPGYKKFSQGIPTWFGLRQTKSKFSIGYKFSYNYLKLNNQYAPLFNTQLINNNKIYGLYSSSYNGFNVSAAPSLYLVAFKKLFFYIDGWVGLDVGYNHLQGMSFAENKVTARIVVPEFRTAFGFQNNRWITAIYYSFINQSLSNQNLNISINYNNFGVIIGYRFYAPTRLLL
jgi:hypothetical protein